MAQTIPLAYACSHGQNNGDAPFIAVPPLLVLKNALCGTCLKHRGQDSQCPHSRTPAAFAYGDAPFGLYQQKGSFLFRARCGFDASEHITVVSGAKGDCTQGQFSAQCVLHSGSGGTEQPRGSKTGAKSHPAPRALLL